MWLVINEDTREILYGSGDVEIAAGIYRTYAAAKMPVNLRYYESQVIWS